MVEVSKVVDKLQSRSVAENPQLRRHRGVVQAISTGGETLTVTLDGGASQVNIRCLTDVGIAVGDTVEIIGDDTDLFAIGKIGPSVVAIDDRISTNTILPSATWTMISWNAASSRNDGGWIHASGSSELVVPVAGWYLLTTTVGFQSSTGGRRIGRFVVNDASGTNETGRQEVQQGADGRCVYNMSVLAYITALGKISVSLYQNSGGDLNAGNIDCNARFGAIRQAG